MKSLPSLPRVLAKQKRGVNFPEFLTPFTIPFKCSQNLFPPRNSKLNCIRQLPDYLENHYCPDRIYPYKRFRKLQCVTKNYAKTCLLQTGIHTVAGEYFDTMVFVNI